MRLKIVFMGTPEFAVPCLKKLHDTEMIAAVITQPDRPKGRGQKLTASPVKEYAVTESLRVLQPQKIKTPEFEALLKEIAPDLIVVVAFGQILSQSILDIPRLGCINVHASLLPHYRGAAPIHWSVINGEKVSGVTTMYMDSGLDTGDMILKTEIGLTDSMTTGELHDALALAGAALLVDTVERLKTGTAPCEKQDAALATYAPLLTKETERIDWTDTAQNIHNYIRGLNPWPGAYTLLRGQTIKLWNSRCVPEEMTSCSYSPGELAGFTKSGILIATGHGILEILELQPASKKKMTARDYVCGHGIQVGEKFV